MTPCFIPLVFWPVLQYLTAGKALGRLNKRTITHDLSPCLVIELGDSTGAAWVVLKFSNIAIEDLFSMSSLAGTVVFSKSYQELIESIYLWRRTGLFAEAQDGYCEK